MVGECRDSVSLCGWVEGFGLRLGGCLGLGECGIRGQRILCLVHPRGLGLLRGSRGMSFSEMVTFGEGWLRGRRAWRLFVCSYGRVRSDRAGATVTLEALIALEY